MAEPDTNPATPPTETPPAATPPAGTPPAQTDDGNTPPAATPPKGDDGATKGDESVTLSRKDYNNLIGQRDSANGQSNFVNLLAQERMIDDFLKTNSDKFGDLTRDDLLHVGDPDDLETEATRLSNRLKEHAQKKLLDITRADTPQLSADEKAAQLKKLGDNPDGDSFEKMLQLQLPTSNKA